MLGVSYGEIFLIIGASAVLLGPKDLPMIARTVGRLAGRSIGYVQLARGQFENVMQQSQAKQVHKELQDTMQQLEAIRHEIRSISFMNPGPMARSLMDKKTEPTPDTSDSLLVETSVPPDVNVDQKLPEPILKENVSSATNLESQATAYARLAEAQLKNDALKSGEEMDILNVLPVSAESAGLLPNRKDESSGSDIMLEAVLEAEVAQNAKQFFAEHQNELKVQ
ncbi:hypothetical protein ACHQM5_008370 [Ranunculus cassubicifolius]